LSFNDVFDRINFASFNRAPDDISDQIAAVDLQVL